MAKKKGGSLFDKFAQPDNVAKSKLLANQKPKAPKPKPQKPGKAGTTPNVPTTAPPGSYDPALDAQQRAADRGVQDVQADVGTANTRGQQDLGTALGLAQRNEARNQADFQTQLSNIFHNFRVQGIQQNEAANAAGVAHGGTEHASQVVRQGNQQRAELPVRLGMTRSAEDYASRVQDINTTASRASADRNTKLQRAIREGGFYKSDIEAEKLYQAEQNNPDLLSALGGGKGKSGKGGKSGKPTKSKSSKKATGQLAPGPSKKKGKK